MDERVDHTETRRETGRVTPVQPQVRKLRRGYWILTGLIVAAVAGGLWYLWQQHQGQPQTQTASPGGRRNAGPAGAPQPVGFATVDKGDVRIILNELGTVTSLDTVNVYTQISGQLQEVAFQEGQNVKKGDFLIQIDPRPYQAALEQAQGTLAKDQGLLAQAQSDLKRYQQLGRQDSIAQQQLEDQKFLVQQYTGQVQTDQGAVDTAKLNLAYCRIVSPVDGRIGLRQVDPGNYVQASSTTAMVVITQIHPISVVFAVPEDNLPDIVKQVRTGATLAVAAYDRSNSTKLADGKLATLDNQIDTTTGTLKLRAVFDNPDELLIPNQFVNARLLVSTMQDTVRVPVPAVQHGEPGTFVYLINADNTVSVRPIKVGPVDGNLEAVTSGLQPGDRVVTDGTDRLRDGSAVTLPAAQGTAGAQAGSGPAGRAGGSQAGAGQPGGGQAGGGQGGGQASADGADSQGQGQHQHRRQQQPPAQ